jgi:indole-3-glycerol phosphate synthase
LFEKTNGKGRNLRVLHFKEKITSLTMNILDTIIANKKIEVAQRKELIPVEELQQYPHYSKPCVSLVSQLVAPGALGIIAEYKRKSPSKGVINAHADIGNVVDAYSRLGASGISVLTDEIYFGGSNTDLTYAREIVNVPLLRKDFMIDEYQLEEAKALGADVILLIAACLSPQRVCQLATFAKKLGLEVLLEIHNDEELQHVCDEVDMVGVNNRNLKNFEVNLQASIELFQKLPKNKIAIAESGISNINTVVSLAQVGFKGFLIGEHFMKQPDPTIAFADFINELRSAT